jgi:hypothetical protein
MPRTAVALIAACGIWAAACHGAAAQSDAAANWPSKSIRAILPIAPGTGADVVFRLVFHELGNRLGQQIVIENRGGAGGTIGSAAAAKADPDGYTILAQSTSHTIAPAIYPNMPYVVTRDFIAVAPLGKMPTALIVAPSKGIKTVQPTGRRGEGQARHTDLRIGWRRFDDAPDCRTLHAERRHQGHSCAIPRRRLSSRGLIGSRRFRVFADRGGGAGCARRPVAGACGQRPRSRFRLPGRADARRGGHR